MAAVVEKLLVSDCIADEAVIAYEDVPKWEPVIDVEFNDPVISNDPDITALPVYGNDEAAVALSAYEAVKVYDDEMEYDEVPCSDPVIPPRIDPVTINEPDTIALPV